MTVMTFPGFAMGAERIGNGVMGWPDVMDDAGNGHLLAPLMK